MALVEFADGPLQGERHDASPDDDVLTVLATMPQESSNPGMKVSIRYRRDGLTSDGLARFVLV